MQTGVMVLQPSNQHFTALWESCSGKSRAKSLDEWVHLEQGFLSFYFDGGEVLESGPFCRSVWQEILPEYNFCVRYCLRPMYEGLTAATASVLHFARAKPWDPMQRNFAPPA